MKLTPIERIEMPSFSELRSEFLDRGVPIIVKNLATDWPALGKWTPAFFRSQYGTRSVEYYDERYQLHGKGYLKPQGRMTFAEYLDLIEQGPTPLRLFLFDLFKLDPKLRQDVVIPPWVDALAKRFLLCFFGGAGGESTFHYDVDLPHVFHTILHGRKEFYLFGPNETPHLHRHPFTVRSYARVSEPDYARFPNLRHARGTHCVLNAGETLVIPSGHWHQVVYPVPSWGISFRKYALRHVPRGLYNVTLQEGIDRLLATAMPKTWFRYKERRAHGQE